MDTETIARLRITLDDVEPAVWRRMEVPVTANLGMLHAVVQAAMGWEDHHLWHIEAGGRRYGVPDPMWPDSGMAAARNVRLATLLDREVRELRYTYDMGDDWRHTIAVEAVGPGEPGIGYPRFVIGERRCPPEDVGGLPGFELFLDAMADPGHEDHDRLREWYGGAYDPDDIDAPRIARALAAIAERRRVGKLAWRKSREP